MLNTQLSSPLVWPRTRAGNTQTVARKHANAYFAVPAGEILPTGFSSLDRMLPGGGWPLSGVIEIIAPAGYVDPLSLLLPALAELSRDPTPRWISWIAPPHLPPNEDLIDAGMILNRTALVHEHNNLKPLRAIEQAVLSGHHNAIVAWVAQLDNYRLANISRAAREHGTTVFLIRPATAEKESSSAELRLYMATHSDTLHVEILHSRCSDGNVLQLANSAAQILYTPRYYRRHINASQHHAIASRQRRLEGNTGLAAAFATTRGSSAKPRHAGRTAAVLDVVAPGSPGASQ